MNRLENLPISPQFDQYQPPVENSDMDVVDLNLDENCEENFHRMSEIKNPLLKPFIWIKQAYFSFAGPSNGFNWSAEQLSDSSEISGLFQEYSSLIKDVPSVTMIAKKVQDIKRNLKQLKNKCMMFFPFEKEKYPLHYAIKTGDEESALSQVVENSEYLNQLRNGNSPLHLAIKCELPRLAKKMIDTQGVLLHALNRNGQTFLHVAVNCLQKKIIVKLVHKGLSLTAGDQDGYTPFHEAILSGNLEIVKLLETSKSPPPLNFSFLSLAVASQSLEMVNYFLDTASDINALNGAHAVLHRATTLCRFPHGMEIINVLLQKGADINKPNTSGRTPFHLAVISANKELVKTFLNLNIPIEAKTRQTTILHLVVYCTENDEMLEFLLQQNRFDVNALNSDGESLLYLAVHIGNISTVEILLKYKVNGELQTNKGKTALSLAFKRGRLDIIMLLEKYGFPVPPFSENSSHLIFKAITSDCRQVLDYLLDTKGYSKFINFVTDDQLETPLMYAVNRDNEKMMAALVEYGADPFQEVEGESPFALAFFSGKIKIALLLVVNRGAVMLENFELFDPSNYPASGLLPLHIAVISQNLKMVQSALKKKDDINTPTPYINGYTPLHIAIYLSHSNEGQEIIQALLDNGADANLLDNDGESPFHLSIKSFEAFTIIIDFYKKTNQKLRQKVDKCNIIFAIMQNPLSNLFLDRLLSYDNSHVNEINSHGFSPLLIAIFNNQSLSIEVLIRYEANVNQKNKAGQTSFELAIFTGNPTITDLLIRNKCDTTNSTNFLFNAVNSGQEEMVDYIIQSFPSLLNQVDEKGYSALNHAVMKSSVPMVKVLLRRGATPNRENHSPQELAFFSQNLDLIKIFLPYKCALSSIGFCPVTKAVLVNNLEVVEYVVSQGYSVNSICPKTHLIPLHSALKQKNLPIFTFLVEHGADLNRRNTAGKTVFDLVVMQPHSSIYDYLKQHDPAGIFAVERRLLLEKSYQNDTAKFYSLCQTHLQNHLIIGNPLPKISLMVSAIAIECKDPILNEILSNLFKAFGKDFQLTEDILTLKNISESKFKTLERIIQKDQLGKAYTTQFIKEKVAYEQVISHLKRFDCFEISGSYPDITILCKNEDLRNKYLIPTLKFFFTVIQDTDQITLNNGRKSQFDQIQKRITASQIEKFLPKKEMDSPSPPTNSSTAPSTAQENEAAAKKAKEEKDARLKRHEANKAKNSSTSNHTSPLRKQPLSQTKNKNKTSKEKKKTRKTKKPSSKAHKNHHKAAREHLNEKGIIMPYEPMKVSAKPLRSSIHPYPASSTNEVSSEITAASTGTDILHASAIPKKSTIGNEDQIHSEEKKALLIQDPTDISRLQIAKKHLVKVRKIFEFHTELLKKLDTSNDFLISYALGLHLMRALGTLYYTSIYEKVGRTDFEDHVHKFVIEKEFAHRIRRQLRHSYDKYPSTAVINFTQNLLEAGIEDKISALQEAELHTRGLNSINPVMLKSSSICEMAQEEGEGKYSRTEQIYRKIMDEIDRLISFRNLRPSSKLTLRKQSDIWAEEKAPAAEVWQEGPYPFDMTRGFGSAQMPLDLRKVSSKCGSSIYFAAYKKCLSNISEGLNALSKERHENIFEKSDWLARGHAWGNRFAHIELESTHKISKGQIYELVENIEHLKQELESLMATY